MSQDHRIVLLEALLARVLSRSRVPLPPPLLATAGPSNGGTHSGHAGTAPATPPPIRPKYSGRPELPPGLFATSQPDTFPTLVESDRWSPSPPPPPPEPPVRNGVHPPAAPEPPPLDVIELDVDPEPTFTPPPEARADAPVAVPPPLESRSRLVVAAPAPEAQEEADDGSFVTDDGPTDPSSAADASLDEVVDDTPSSSRRPISLETKMSEPDDDAPLHSPPPRSGSLPAALPTFDLALEPIVPLEQIEPETSSVNLVPRSTEPIPAPVESGASVVRADVRAEMSTREDVAVFVAPARPPAPATTFGELLDEALSL